MAHNKEAIHLLKENQQKIDWIMLSCNENAMDLIMENMDKINFALLSANKNSISVLKKHMSKISWDILGENENIFVYDYEKMKARLAIFKEELLEVVFHPDRICNLLKKGYVLSNLF